MAIIRASSIVGAISGNLAGVNFAIGKSGPYARQRTPRTQATSKGTIHTQARFQFLRHQWQKVTDAQRTAWRQAAANRRFTNRVGVRSALSGHALFIQQNMHGWPDDGPEAVDFDANPPTLAAPPPLRFVSLTIDAGGTKRMVFVPPASPTTTRQVIYGARTSSTAPRRSWYQFKFLTRANIPSAPPFIIIDFTSEWDERIGDPQVGELCWTAWFTAGPNRWPTPTFNISKFAT